MEQSSHLRVGVIGCGIVGAAIAYELSQVPELSVTVLDQRSPGQWAATGAGLGVLMGAISRRLKGNTLRMKLASLQRYETLVPELEDLTGWEIPFNRQGILQLCFNSDELNSWQKLVEFRCSQGFRLEILDSADVAVRCPEMSHALVSGQLPIGAIYSPQDRQVEPIALTRALIQAAQQNGVTFHFQTTVQGFTKTITAASAWVDQIQTNVGDFPVDWLVLASGLGSTLLTGKLEQQVEIQPVLGQALHLRRRQPLKEPRPVIYGGDVYLVPLNSAELWVGATVEFPTDKKQEVRPDPDQLETVLQHAIALCPSLAEATIVRTWSGLRPRPQNRPAPVVEPLPDHQNVLLATGHYRNGILLAPATAQKIRAMIDSLANYDSEAG